MDSLGEMADRSYWEKVERARGQSMDEKFRDGIQLFDFACRVMADGVRMQHPDASDAEISRMVSRRVELLRKLEESD